MPIARPRVLICDDDRLHADALADGLERLGYAGLVTRSFADAFALACTFDLDMLVAGSMARDGSTLALPSALGIRRPRLVVLATRIGERIALPIAQRVGFDLELTKVVDAKALDRLAKIAALRARARGRIEPAPSPSPPAAPTDTGPDAGRRPVA